MDEGSIEVPSHLKVLLRVVEATTRNGADTDVQAIYVPQVGISAGDVLHARLIAGRIATERLDTTDTDFEKMARQVADKHPGKVAANALMVGRFGSPIGIVSISGDQLPQGIGGTLTEEVNLFTDYIAFEKTSGVFESISSAAGFIAEFHSLQEVSRVVCSVLTNALYCQAAYGWQVNRDFLKSFGDTNLSMSARDGLAGLAAQTGKVIVAHDILNQKENLRKFGRDIRHRSVIARMNVNDAIFIPILTEKKEPIAVFAIYFKRRGGATELDEVLARYVVSHFSSYFQLNGEITRLRSIEKRLLEKTPYINSVLSVLSDMHDLQNHIRGIENELIQPGKAPSSRLAGALARTEGALELLKSRRDWMTLPTNKEEETTSILAPDRRFNRLVVRDLVDSAASVFIAELKNDRIELENAVSSTIRIRGYAGALRRALENLISNAVKVLRIRSGPKRIVVGTRNVSNGDLELFVEDNGGGILPEDEKYMYDLLYSSWGQAGMGLGLTIVRSAAELHEGTLTHYNRPGRGAEFRIILPAALVIER